MVVVGTAWEDPVRCWGLTTRAHNQYHYKSAHKREDVTGFHMSYLEKR